MVFCFGELLLRMSPSLDRRWIRAQAMPVYVGGAELNVATALSKWNIPTRYATALPDHYLSREIIEEITSKGIDSSSIHLSGSRIGVYYLPQGADLKNAGVIYDREHSSFSHLQPGMIDWDKALDGCTWFHFSAISPALNQHAVAVCKEALEVAQARKMTISVDLNYRAKLWQYGKQPVQVMPDLVSHCHVIMGNIWSVESLLGIPASIEESKGRSRDELLDACGKSMMGLHKNYPQASSFAYTFRLENDYWAVLQHGTDRAISKEFAIKNVVDKVGSGDCFMGGLIYGLYSNNRPKDVIDFAAAAAVGKLQVKGDATNQTVEEIKTMLNN